MSLPKKVQLLSLALCTLHSFPAYAESPAPIQVAFLDLPLEKLLTLEVVTASKFRQSLSDAPSAMTVLTAEDIKVYGWRTLAEALGSIRGLYVSNDQNYTYLGGRGFSRPGDYNTRFLLLIDGIRSNDALYDQASIGHDAPVDIDLIERIEYAPGSGSSIYGSNAFFGVINIITKSAQHLVAPQASVETGSAGEKKLRASHGFTTEGGAAVLISATAYRRQGKDQYYPEFDSSDSGFGVAQGLDRERNNSFLFKTSIGPFSASVVHNDRERAVPTASYGQAFNDSRSKTRDAQTMASLSYQDSLNETTQLIARTFWGQHVYQGRYAYRNPDYLNHDESTSAWAGTELSLLATAWQNHKILAGIEYQHEFRRDQSSDNVYPAGSPDAPSSGGGAQRERILDDRRSGDRKGFYLQDEIAVRENFLVNLGARYDHYANAAGAVNPRLALIYKPLPDTTFKAIYGRAFRAPNAYEMYYVIEGPGGQKANPALKPERIRSTELSVERKLGRHASILASVYENKVTDLISQSQDSDGLLVFRNLSRASSRGLELQYEYMSAKGVKLRASQSWQKAKDDATGLRLANSPRSLAKLNLMLPVWEGKATAGLEGRYVGRRLTRDSATGGYWLANATLYSEKLVDKVELSASVYNLFDRRYRDPGGEEHVQEALPQEGRSFRIKLTYKF